MIAGDFFIHEDKRLIISARSINVESGLVMSTGEVGGERSSLGELVYGLEQSLTGGLTEKTAGMPGEIDRAPVPNLHFMRGLSYYFAARYHQAAAEFIESAKEETLEAVSRLWLAESYLAEEEYGQAYLELRRLMDSGSLPLRSREIAEKLNFCRDRLPAGDIRLIDKL